MKEQAKVIEINGKRVTVGCIASACAACQSEGACTVKEQKYEADNSNDLDLAPGEMVEVYLPPAKTIGAAFSIMILPLLLFVTGFLLGSRVLGIASEGINVLFGLGGLGFGFGLNLFVSRIMKKNSYPVILRKV